MNEKSAYAKYIIVQCKFRKKHAYFFSKIILSTPKVVVRHGDVILLIAFSCEIKVYFISHERAIYTNLYYFCTTFINI